MVFPAKALSLLSVSCLKMEICRFMRNVKAIEHIWQAFHLEGWRQAGKGVSGLAAVGPDVKYGVTNGR